MTQGVVLRRRRRASPWLAMPLISILILTLGWSSLWMFGRREAARIMEAWISGEAGHGRLWSCPNREITGFPLTIHVSCRNPTYKGSIGRDVVQASFAGLDAETFIYQPSQVDLSATGPLTVHDESGGGADTILAWSGLHMTFRGLVADRRRASLLLDGAELTLPDGSTSRADRLDVRLGPAPGRPAEEDAYEVLLTLDNGQIPALDALTGTGDSLAVEEKGVLTDLAIARFASWQELAERWRVAGGTLELAALSLAKGDLHADAQGSLRIDDAHRPAGKLIATMSGYKSLAARLGIPLQAISVGGAIAQLLNRGAPGPATQDGAGVSLPIVLADGRVLVGPFKTALRLAPLY